MRKLPLLFLSLLLLLAACNKQNQDPVLPEPDLSLSSPITPLDGRDPLTRNQINRLVTQHLLSENQFRWDMVDDYVTWSAGTVSDSIYSIGYQPEGYQDIAKTIHEVDVNSPAWASVRQALIDFVVAEENIDREGTPLTAEDLLAFGEKPLPYFNIKITRYETVARLRHMKIVRYVEPMGYGTEVDVPGRSESGCGGGAASSLPSSDYTTVSPGAKVSWNYYQLNIPGAWTYSQGDNIAVGLIDTGISPNQDKLNSNFATSWSTGRFRQK